MNEYYQRQSRKSKVMLHYTEILFEWTVTILSAYWLYLSISDLVRSI